MDTLVIVFTHTFSYCFYNYRKKELSFQETLEAFYSIPSDPEDSKGDVIFSDENVPDPVLVEEEILDLFYIYCKQMFKVQGKYI